MRVIVTRPETSALRTAERLQKLGHTPVLLPLTKPVHDQQVAAVALAREHSALAVTSAEAIRVMASLGRHLDPYLNDVIYAVGEATAEAARNLGFQAIRTGPGTGAELAEIIAGYASSKDDPVLYLAGNPRSPKFEETLHSNLVRFHTVTIYQMNPIAYDRQSIAEVIGAPQVDAVLLYSQHNARLFFELIDARAETLSEMQLLCLSDAIAEVIPPEFHKNIRIARKPDEDALFALL